MIEIIGLDWPSVRVLRQCLEGVDPRLNLQINWGGSTQGALNAQPRHDGVNQLTLMREVGLNVPVFTRSYALARQWVLERKEVWGRKLIHTKGQDIVGFRHPRWKNSEWWVQVIGDVEAEWRLHVVKGKVIARGLKVKTGQPWRKLVVRNRRNGWTMVHDVEPTEEMRKIAKKAVAACGYDFGAVDMIVRRDGSVWVLEVNKAPGLDAYTAGKYMQQFVRIAKRKRRKERNADA